MSLLSDFQLTAYWYKMENIYPNFATFWGSSTKTNIIEISQVMAELEDKTWIQNDSTILPTYSVTAT